MTSWNPKPLKEVFFNSKPHETNTYKEFNLLKKLFGTNQYLDNMFNNAGHIHNRSINNNIIVILVLLLYCYLFCMYVFIYHS